MEQFNKLSEILKEICEITEGLFRFEEEKIYAAEENDTKKMENIIREEEALLLKLRGAEARRKNELKAFGWEELKAEEILGQCSETDRACLQPILDEMGEKARELKKMQKKASIAVTARIRQLDGILSRTKSGGSAFSYTSEGQPISGSSMSMKGRYV